MHTHSYSRQAHLPMETGFLLEAFLYGTSRQTACSSSRVECQSLTAAPAVAVRTAALAVHAARQAGQAPRRQRGISW